MGKQRQENFTHPCSSSDGWERAIREADWQIADAESKIVRLRLSIETFKQMRSAGEVLPGDTSELMAKSA
jgi:hypothetical protein